MKERCSKRYVLTAATNAKCPLNPRVGDQFTAENVIGNTKVVDRYNYIAFRLFLSPF